MKVFLVSYRWTGRFQTFDNRDFVVVAERADKAIGMVLQENEDLKADLAFWSAMEIPTTMAVVYSACRIAHKTMTDQQIIEAVLTSCGWTLSSAQEARENWSTQRWVHSDGRQISRGYAASILTSLDACHEVFLKTAPYEFWKLVFANAETTKDFISVTRFRVLDARFLCETWLKFKGAEGV